MKFKDSDAGRLPRWAELFVDIFGEWDVLWVELDDGWSGSCKVLVTNGQEWIFANWSWGSCSACDGFEELTPEDRVAEAERCVMRFKSRVVLNDWLDMMSATSPDAKAIRLALRGSIVLMPEAMIEAAKLSNARSVSVIYESRDGLLGTGLPVKLIDVLEMKRMEVTYEPWRNWTHMDVYCAHGSWTCADTTGSHVDLVVKFLRGALAWARSGEYSEWPKLSAERLEKALKILGVEP